MAGDGHGGFMLERDPLKGLALPREKNPRRIALTSVEYQMLLEAAPEVDWRFHVALVLAHETGHRIGAIRRLLWSDVDLENGLFHWRGENEKTGYSHTTPMTSEAREALEYARRRSPGIGNAPILPAPKDGSKPVGRYLVRGWWRRAEKLAGLERKDGRGWHSLRRKFATELMHEPLKVLCKLGGWMDAETVLTCYQQPDEEAMRVALEGRKKVSKSG
jgi:integrase